MRTGRSLFTFILLTLLNIISVTAENIRSPISLYSNTEVNDEVFIKFLDKQNEQIAVLTQALNEQNDFLKQASLLNERGTIYFFIGQFENAINDFSYVIDNVTSKFPEEETLLGAALWGRMLCYAFEGQVDSTHNDSLMLADLFTECPCDKDQEKESLLTLSNCNDHGLVLPIAKFAYPEEEISKSECHDRVDTITSKAHSLVSLIPDWITKQTVHGIIDLLEKEAHKCCNSNQHWTECLGSMIDVWKKLETTWDQLVDLFKRGTNLRLFLTSPLNL